MTDVSLVDRDELQAWIVSQRWFGSKSREVSQIDIAEVVTLRARLCTHSITSSWKRRMWAKIRGLDGSSGS